MLLDIAYYFRHIGSENTKIYGIFTMYDEALTSDAPRIQLANCYASLVELDYYKQNATEYATTLPNGPTVRKNKSPFDIVTFLSATNMEGERFINSAGQFVQPELDRTIASDLFVRSLGVDAIIDADLVNSPGFDDRFENVRNGNQLVHYMFSSGLQKVWLPKNHTVKAAATIFIKELSSKWKGDHWTNLSDAATLFGTILTDIKANLSTISIGSFESQLKAESANIASPTEAYDSLATLVAGGRYFKRFDANSKNCLNQAVATLQGSSREVLNEVSDLIQAELKKTIYPNRLEDTDEIKKRVDQAELSAQISTGGFLGFGKNTELNTDKFRNGIYDQLHQLGVKLQSFFVKRVLNELPGEIQKLIDDRDNEKGTIETKFVEAINFFNKDVPDEIANAANRLSQEYPGGLSTPASVDELIKILRLVSPDCFHWHIANKLRGSFNSIAE